jgi:hypothetical protein
MTTKNDKIEDNPLFLVDTIEKEWAKEVKQYMDDEDLSHTLDLVVRVIANPNIPPQKVAMLCTQLEAYAIKFRLMFVGYMSYKKGTTEANMKKNHYKELYTGLDRLVDSLKYLVK